MKFTDKLIGKYGADKLLHFTIPMVAILATSLINFIVGCIMFILISILCYIKERYLDTNFNKQDFIAGILGGLLSIIYITILKFIFKL